MYSIAICENEKIQADELISILEKYKNKKNIKFKVDYFESGEDLIAGGYDKYNIIFMDVKMGKLDGFDTAKLIRKTNKLVKIIFITCMEEYWSEGYKVAASGYLLKPIKEELFFDELNGLIDTINKEKSFINVTKDGDMIRVLISDIKYMVIEDRVVAVHTIDGIYYSNYSINYFAENLAVHNFAKPHNSYLVNLEYIKMLNKEKVTLIDGDEIYISKRKYKEFKDIFTVFLGMI